MYYLLRLGGANLCIIGDLEKFRVMKGWSVFWKNGTVDL